MISETIKISVSATRTPNLGDISIKILSRVGSAKAIYLEKIYLGKNRRNWYFSIGTIKWRDQLLEAEKG